MCGIGWSYKRIPPYLKVGRLSTDYFNKMVITTEVKLRGIVSAKGNPCLVVQTKIDVKVVENGKEIIRQLAGVIPQVGNESLPTGTIISATITVAKDKNSQPQIVGMEVNGQSVNMDWFYDPQMQQNRQVIEL